MISHLLTCFTDKFLAKTWVKLAADGTAMMEKQVLLQCQPGPIPTVLTVAFQTTNWMEQTLEYVVK